MDRTNVKGAVEAALEPISTSNITALAPFMNGVLSFAVPAREWLFSCEQGGALDASARKLATAITALTKRIFSMVDAQDAAAKINDAALSVGSGLNQATSTPALLTRLESLHPLKLPTVAGLFEQAAAGKIPGKLSGKSYQVIADKIHHRPQQSQDQIAQALPPLEKLSAVGGMLENQFAGRVAENLSGPLLQITDTVMANLPEIQAFLTALTDKIGETGSRIAKWLPTALNAIIAVKNAVGGWKPLLDWLEKIAWAVALVKGMRAVLAGVNNVKNALKEVKGIFSWFHKSKPIFPDLSKYRKALKRAGTTLKGKASRSLRTVGSALKQRLLPALAWSKGAAGKLGKQGVRLLRAEGRTLVTGVKAVPRLARQFMPVMKRALPLAARTFSLSNLLPLASRTLNLSGLLTLVSRALLSNLLMLILRPLGWAGLFLIPTNNTPNTSKELSERDRLARRNWEKNRTQWAKENPNQPLPESLSGDFQAPSAWMSRAQAADSALNFKTLISPKVGATSNALLAPFAPQAVDNMRDENWLAAHQPELTYLVGRPAASADLGAAVNNTSVQNHIEQSNQFHIYESSEPKRTADAITDEMLGVYSQLNEIFSPGGY